MEWWVLAVKVPSCGTKDFSSSETTTQFSSSTLHLIGTDIYISFLFVCLSIIVFLKIIIVGEYLFRPPINAFHLAAPNIKIMANSQFLICLSTNPWQQFRIKLQ